MDTTTFTDAKELGRGLWFIIHLDGVHAVTDAGKQSYETRMNILCENFKCKSCQPHFRKFIDTHPFKLYWNIKDAKGRDIGMFKWSWEFHNQVNRFLKKYEPTLEEAYAYFSNADAGACFDCNKTVPELRSRAIPPILSLYRETGIIKPQPFKLIPK